MSGSRRPSSSPGRHHRRDPERRPGLLPDAGLIATLRRRSSRNPLLTAAVLAVVHLLLALLTVQPAPHTGGDNAAYIALGQSLFQHHEYRSLYDPGTPLHTQYPPVFPAVLGSAMALGLEPWFQLKLIIALFSAIAVGVTYLWIRRRRRPMLALGVSLLLAASPGVLELGRWILSDVPFWMFTAISLWAFERLRPELRGRFAVAVVATILAYFTRSAGLPLLVAAFGWLTLRRHWKQLAVLAAVALPLAGAWWLRAKLQGGVDYVSQFWLVDPYTPALGRIGAIDLFDRVLDNASRYINIHLPILLTGNTGTAPLAAGLGVLGLGIFGWVKRLRRPTLAELFLPLYIGLLLVWPSVWSGERFLLPALPLLLCYAGDGLVRVARALRPAAALATGVAAVALVAVLGLPADVASVRASGRCMLDYRTGNRYPCLAPVWGEFFRIGEWSRTALPDGAVVISRKPRLFWAISGRQGIVYPFSDRATDLIRAAQDVGARYIVLDGLGTLSQRYLVPALLQRPEAFCMMTSLQGGTAMLGILPDAASRPDREAGSTAATLARCAPDFWRESARPVPTPPPDTAASDSAAADTARTR
jgi:hypothetical protein